MQRRRNKLSRDAERYVNLWLNLSQAALVRELGAQRVNELVHQFKHEATKQPKLWEMLYNSEDPYRWLCEKSQDWQTPQ